MIKTIDLDKLFDKFIEKYVYENIGKISNEQIEDNIPKLYVKFGDVKIKELDGLTPNTFYLNKDGKELLDCLKDHLLKNVSVSDFLCEAIVKNEEN